MILAADLGGTKTVLALYDAASGMERPLLEEAYPSREYDSLETIVGQFLEMTQTKPMAACFGVAGPVIDRRAPITNLPWIIDAEAISQTFDIPQVHLLNDLQASAIAVPHLTSDAICTLNVGQPDPTGTIGVIAPGTGLYDFLRMRQLYDEPEWLLEALAQASDPTPVIIRTALSGKVRIYIATLDLFVCILGGVISNLALQVFATGGLYLGGGIPPRILSRLQRIDFHKAICYKGRFSDWVARIPLHVILDPKTALHGAAWHALEVLGH
jgi:glucokinase